MRDAGGSGYLLKVEATGCADGLDVWCKAKGGVKSELCFWPEQLGHVDVV